MSTVLANPAVASAVPVNTDGGADGRRLPGRNRVSERALRAVASAITAEAMGVAPRDVSIELADDAGRLGVNASTPIRVHALGSTRTGASVLDRATSAQKTIRERMLELTGSDVGRVRIRVTGTTLGKEQRL